MNRAIYGLLLLLIVVAVLVVLYDRGYFSPPEPVVVTEKVPVPPQSTPEIAYPLPEPPVAAENAPVEPEEILPTLGRSDALVREILARLFAVVDLDSLFITEDFIRRLVIMIDNLTRERLPLSHLPLRLAPGSFLVTEGAEETTISPENYRRYDPYVRLAANVDAKAVVAAYVRLYPLFQKAYSEMGYKKVYFNDRLIEVIDHLLSAPEVDSPVRLESHVMRYKYADPELEALSAGRKIMIRIGPENATVVKAKLRALRKELVKGGSKTLKR